MTDSILTSTKLALGIAEDYEDFDMQLIMHINTVLVLLDQLGAGKSNFTISDKTATWTDYIGDQKNMSLVKSYMYAKVRELFDPPQSSTVMNALSQVIAELEWRITISHDENVHGYLDNSNTTDMDITIDNSLSETSTNPVQNKAITAALSKKENRVDKITNFSISEAVLKAFEGEST